MSGTISRISNPNLHSGLNLPNIEEGKHSEVKHPQPHAEKEPELPVGPVEEAVLSAKNVALLSIFLLLLAVGLGIWSWTKWSGLEKTMQTETVQHEAVLDSLIRLKGDMESQLNQLESEFAGLSGENELLANRLASATNIVAEKENAIREIRGQSAREERVLRGQVQRLQTLTDRYETIIAVLNQKNAALAAENARLRGTTDSLSLEISDLGRKLEAQIRQTLSAQFRASAFRVEMERRNDKLTVRARRTRELGIRFELNNVPAMFQGNQQFYLVITDDKGLPIESKNPVQATIRAEKGSVSIIAQATRFEVVAENQGMTWNYKLEDRLKKGTYVVSVYSEKGLLGVASFRLT